MNIYRERLEPEAMAQYQWLPTQMQRQLLGLPWKLLSGSCVIRARSARGQWFHHRLQHQQHLVEVE